MAPALWDFPPPLNYISSITFDILEGPEELIILSDLRLPENRCLDGSIVKVAILIVALPMVCVFAFIIF